MVDSWRVPILAALQPFLKLLGPQLRPMLVGEHCAGMAPLGAVLGAFHMPFRELFVSDPKPAARLFREGYGCQQSERQYDTIRDVIESLPRERPDLEVSGFPCQPFSTMRNGRFKSKLPKKHQQYTVADQLLQAMAMTRPRCAIVEQVKGFGMAQNQGPSELDRFIAKIDAAGIWHHLVMSASLSHWVEASRERIYIVLVDRDSG